MTFDARKARLTPNSAEYQRLHRWVVRQAVNTAVVAVGRDGSLCQYDSLTEASKTLGVLRTSISNALRGWAKTAGGYEWRYL